MTLTDAIARAKNAPLRTVVIYNPGNMAVDYRNRYETRRSHLIASDDSRIVWDKYRPNNRPFGQKESTDD
jgi:hypothetical protein